MQYECEQQLGTGDCAKQQQQNENQIMTFVPQAIEEDAAEIDPVGVLQALARLAGRSARRVWDLVRPQ